MPRDTADLRVRAGRLAATTVVLERPETEVRGPGGNVFVLPRRPADAVVPVYQKINSRVLDPATGERRQRGNRGLAGRNRQRSLGFGALALSAFVGFRALQQLVRCIRRRQPPQTEQEALEAVLALEDDAHAAAALPPVRVFPGLLRRALPQLGPPSRSKRAAQQHRARPRRVPTAAQKMQPRGAVQRRATTLQRWHTAVKQQVHALMALQQQQQQHDAPGLVLAAEGLQQTQVAAAAAAAAAVPASRQQQQGRTEQQEDCRRSNEQRRPGLVPLQPLLEVAEASAGGVSGSA